MFLTAFNSWQHFVLYTLLVLLIGAAVPIVFLRFVARDKEDSCFLTVILLGLLFVAMTGVIALLIFARN